MKRLFFSTDNTDAHNKNTKKCSLLLCVASLCWEKKLTTGHFGIRVLPQVSIKHSITDLVAHFIWNEESRVCIAWISACVPVGFLVWPPPTAHARFLIWAEPEDITFHCSISELHIFNTMNSLGVVNEWHPVTPSGHQSNTYVYFMTLWKEYFTFYSTAL